MNLYSVTDVGRKRKVNQDYVYVSDQPVGNLPNLFVVADGMGGHNAGDFASSFAVKIVVEAVKTDADYNPVKIIRHAIETANDELINQAVPDGLKTSADYKRSFFGAGDGTAWRASGRRSPKSSGQKYYYQSVGSQERCEHRFL